MSKIKIVYFGTPDIGLKTLDYLNKSEDFEVLAVVTQPDKPVGRGHKLTIGPIKKYAIDNSRLHTRDFVFLTTLPCRRLRRFLLFRPINRYFSARFRLGFLHRIYRHIARRRLSRNPPYSHFYSRFCGRVSTCFSARRTSRSFPLSL